MSVTPKNTTPTFCNAGNEKINNICYGPCGNLQIHTNKTLCGLYNQRAGVWGSVSNRPSSQSLCQGNYTKNDSTCYENCPSNTVEDGNNCVDCTSADLENSSICFNWCNNNRDRCYSPINNYCNKRLINNNELPNICIGIQERVKEANCTTNVNLLNPSNTICRDYCKSNTNSCRNNIKSYCTGDKINNDQFCKDVLVSHDMNGQHDSEMIRFCNNEGKNTDICACLDSERVRNSLADITDQEIKNDLVLRPDCYYSPCISNTTYRKNESNPCKNIQICKINVGGSINILNSNNVTIKNDCITKTIQAAPATPVAPATPATPVAPATPATPVAPATPAAPVAPATPVAPAAPAIPATTTNNSEPNIKSVQDCQMSDWTKCSNMCINGEQTRNIITKPQNNGKSCGPIKQTCLITCTTLIDQVKNNYFNFNELDMQNKVAVFVIGLLIVIFVVIFF